MNIFNVDLELQREHWLGFVNEIRFAFGRTVASGLWLLSEFSLLMKDSTLGHDTKTGSVVSFCDLWG